MDGCCEVWLYGIYWGKMAAVGMLLVFGLLEAKLMLLWVWVVDWGGVGYAVKKSEGPEGMMGLRLGDLAGSLIGFTHIRTHT